MTLYTAIALGWTPILALVSNGSGGYVLQVTGWTGGSGTAPATGLYVGPTGYVSTVGAAVVVSGGGGSIDKTIVTKTGNYTAVTGDQVILVDATTGNVVITLPAPGSKVGHVYTIKKIDSTTHTVTIVPVSGLLEFGAGALLSLQGASIDTIDNTTNYLIV